MRAFAQRLGYNDAVKLLTQTIDEEGKADQTLTKIATGGVNQMAVA